MKEFKNKIEIAPVADIDSVDGTTLNMKTGRTADEIFSSNDIIPGEKDVDGGGFRYYSQSLEVICDSLTTTLYNRYRNRKVIIKLIDSQDNELLLGSLANPARCSMERKLIQDILAITCDTPNPLVS
ncbi:MAG: hypothetical protein V2B15_08665 [Bacteroidota bacterium]